MSHRPINDSIQVTQGNETSRFNDMEKMPSPETTPSKFAANPKGQQNDDDVLADG